MFFRCSDFPLGNGSILPEMTFLRGVTRQEVYVVLA